MDEACALNLMRQVDILGAFIPTNQKSDSTSGGMTIAGNITQMGKNGLPCLNYGLIFLPNFSCCSWHEKCRK